ncbi:MAG: GNAT family N-acetyltransferase [Deltaproteobacteria bacterium]|nr:GNAT family N-acetyltransferase [Candidatus Zymogenaceae bacterium]
MHSGKRRGVVEGIRVTGRHRNMGLGTEPLHEAERWFFKKRRRSD